MRISNCTAAPRYNNLQLSNRTNLSQKPAFGSSMIERNIAGEVFRRSLDKYAPDTFITIKRYPWSEAINIANKIRENCELVRAAMKRIMPPEGTQEFLKRFAKSALDKEIIDVGVVSAPLNTAQVEVYANRGILPLVDDSPLMNEKMYKHLLKNYVNNSFILDIDDGRKCIVSPVYWDQLRFSEYKSFDEIKSSIKDTL